MQGHELYSDRQTRSANVEKPQILQYQSIPNRMRGQAFNSLVMLGGNHHDYKGFWKRLEDNIVREHGLYGQIPVDSQYSCYRIAGYLDSVGDVDLFLDIVELGIREAQRPNVKHLGRDQTKHVERQMRRIDEAIQELNDRFRHHHLGYQFVGFPGIIVRIDTQYIQAEMVDPAAAQLSSIGWQGPLDEFLNAHRYYRHSEYKSAMNEALKAFESTMKAVLHARDAQYEETWPASQLLNAMFDNDLMPRSLESYFNGIKSVLQSGVPMLRNRQSGHGQGPSIIEVPGYVAAFTLHLTAANIVFILSAHADKPVVKAL